MPLYVIERETGRPLSDDELAEAVKRSKKAVAEIGKIKWIKSYAPKKSNILYCVFESPNVELLYEHAKKAQLSINKISEVKEIDANTFK